MIKIYDGNLTIEGSPPTIIAEMLTIVECVSNMLESDDIDIKEKIVGLINEGVLLSGDTEQTIDNLEKEQLRKIKESDHGLTGLKKG